MREDEGTGIGEGSEEKQMELQLGSRHLTLAVVGLAVFGGVLFLLGRWSERVARPAEKPEAGIEESSIAGSSRVQDPAEPRELTFYETLGKKSTPAFREASPRTARKEAPAVLPDSPAPPSPAKPKASGLSTPAPAGKERFRVQVASTRDPAAARRLVDHLRKKGYAASMERFPGPNGITQYKVRVGNYERREPAVAEAARIRAEEKVGAWIVKVQG